MIILLDPGHGGHDSGAVEFGQEKDYTLKIALKLREFLMAKGAAVLMTRDKDISMRKADRLKIAKYADADLILSIHLNAAEGKGTGTEVFKSGNDNTLLAEKISRSISDLLNIPDRGSKDGDRFYILNSTPEKAQALLIEIGFIDRKEDMKAINEKWVEVAEDIAKVIGDHFNLTIEHTQQNHWAEASFQSLQKKGLKICERRFNDPVTRGELFALLDRITT